MALGGVLESDWSSLEPKTGLMQAIGSAIGWATLRRILFAPFHSRMAKLASHRVGFGQAGRKAGKGAGRQSTV